MAIPTHLWVASNSLFVSAVPYQPLLEAPGSIGLRLLGGRLIVAQISSVSLSEMKGLPIYEDRFPIIAINNKDFEIAKTFSLFYEVAHLIGCSVGSTMMNVMMTKKKYVIA